MGAFTIYGKNQTAGFIARWFDITRITLKQVLTLYNHPHPKKDGVKEKSMEWISVKDRLPEQYHRVFVYKPNCAIACYGCAIYNGKQFMFDASLIAMQGNWEKLSDRVISGVTHWAPIKPHPELINQP